MTEIELYKPDGTLATKPFTVGFLGGIKENEDAEPEEIGRFKAGMAEKAEIARLGNHRKICRSAVFEGSD